MAPRLKRLTAVMSWALALMAMTLAFAPEALAHAGHNHGHPRAAKAQAVKMPETAPVLVKAAPLPTTNLTQSNAARPLSVDAHLLPADRSSDKAASCPCCTGCPPCCSVVIAHRVVTLVEPSTIEQPAEHRRCPLGRPLPAVCTANAWPRPPPVLS